MTTVEQQMTQIRRVAERVGYAEFARLSGVPRTTIYGYAVRNWEHSRLDAFGRMAETAARLERVAARLARDGSEGKQGVAEQQPAVEIAKPEQEG